MLSAQKSSSPARNFPENLPLEYSILTHTDEIASIGPDWDSLLARSRCNRAFSCSKWYLATPYLLPELNPLVIIARRDGALAGILPLWLNVDGKEAGFPDDYSDHLDIIAADDDMEAISGLLSTALRGETGYRRLALTHIKPESNCVRAARELGLLHDMDEAFAPSKALAYAVLDLACGYQEYSRCLSRKFRLNLNRMRNKAKKDGLEVLELRPPDIAPESLPELFLSLHESRFGKDTSLRSVCKTPEAWIRHLFPSLFAEGRMRVFAVLHKGRIAGIDLATVTKCGMYAWNGGFAEHIACYEPGKLLIHKAIQQCCLEGLPEYDIGWFGQQYKAHWKPVIRYVGALHFKTHS
jgi:CelD/BcsL family acetyltransferase involved in cellulose biosynthesis